MLFLQSDWKKVDDENRTFETCVDKANERFDRGEYAEAQLYLNNATRALTELNRMMISKEQHDQKWFVTKQIESQQHADKLFYELRSKYE